MHVSKEHLRLHQMKVSLFMCLHPSFRNFKKQNITYYVPQKFAKNLQKISHLFWRYYVKDKTSRIFFNFVAFSQLYLVVKAIWYLLNENGLIKQK